MLAWMRMEMMLFISTKKYIKYTFLKIYMCFSVYVHMFSQKKLYMKIGENYDFISMIL